MAGGVFAGGGGFVEGSGEKYWAALPKRNFRPVNLGNGIIETKGSEGGQQVFDGGNADAMLVGEDGAKAGFGYIIPEGGDGIGAVFDIGADKSDAGERRRGMNCHGSRRAG